MGNKILVNNGEKKKIRDLFQTSYPTVRIALEGAETTALHVRIRKMAIERGGMEMIDKKTNQREALMSHPHKINTK